MAKRTLKVGDKVCYLSDYDLEKNCVVISIGKKNIKLKTHYGEKYVDISKVIHEDDFVCVVWERWKGKNGRGGYRLETDLYKNRQRVAKNFPYQVWVYEDSMGVESEYVNTRLI